MSLVCMLYETLTFILLNLSRNSFGPSFLLTFGEFAAELIGAYPKGERKPGCGDYTPMLRIGY